MKEIRNMKKYTRIALFIALSCIGATIQINGSIAFDSMPAFVGAVYLGPLAGGIIAIVGHLLSALLAGFYLTLPVHIIIAIMMGLTMLVFGYIYKSNKVLAGIIAVIMNAPLTLLLLVPLLSWGFAIGLLPVLTLASIVNVILAMIILRYLKNER